MPDEILDELPEGTTISSTPADMYDTLPEGAQVNSAKLTPAQQKWQEYNNDLNSIPGFQTAGHMYQQFLKGMPIIGRFMNADLPGNADFEKEHPWLTGGSRMAGAITAAAPLSAAAMLPEAGTATSILEGTPTASNLIPNMLRQGTLFGSLATGDEAAQKYHEGGTDAVVNTPTSEYAKTFGLNGLFGSMGPLLSKIISPNAIEKTPLVQPEPTPTGMKASDFMDLAKRMTPEEMDDLSRKFADPVFMRKAIDDQELLRQVFHQPNQASNQMIADAINNTNAANRTSAINKVKDTGFNPDIWDAWASLAGGALGHMIGGGENTIIGLLGAPAVKQVIQHGAPIAKAAYSGNQFMSYPGAKSILNSLIGESGDTAYMNNTDSR